MKLKLLTTAICASLALSAWSEVAAADSVGILSNVAVATVSAAQQNQSDTTDTNKTKPDDQTAQTLDEVTVTGSLLKRPEYQSIIPVQVVNIDADQATGSFGTVDLLQSTAVAMGSTQINNQFSGFIVGGGTGIQTIDLRGLGANRTLVLLDGQRPGPAGVQGQTGSGFDLNVVPDSILGRVEIIKGGSSSIYGSDAISGVVNLITKKRIDGTHVQAYYSIPQHGGGEQATASVATGLNFDKGNFVLAAQFSKQSPLAYGDRDFLKCSQDMVWGADGRRIDREDHSILQGTKYAGCNSLLQNEAISYWSGDRFVPAGNRPTNGPLPGMRLAEHRNYGEGGPAYYEEVLNSSFMDKAWAINKNQNTSVYGSSHFLFGNVTWDNQLLFNQRKTNTKGWRQFFPVAYHEVPVGSADDASAAFGLPDQGIGLFQPIMPYPSNDEVKVDYFYFRTSLDGGFGNSTWDWHANATHSRSSGTYSHIGIDDRKSGDQTSAINEMPGFDTPIDYFDPGILDGTRMQDLVNAVGLPTKGKTTYSQTTVNALVTGDLFSLPAGDVSAAFGAEFRRYEINDTPDANNRAGYEWGYSSAQETKGRDHVGEVFAEVGIPLLSGIPGVESLALDLSARGFKYQSVGEFDHVWKTGLNWQVTPTFRVRGSIGTSYRAPQLYELYLGNQSGFLPQLGTDPCIKWGESVNDFIRANCAAAGIPDDYNASGNSSAQIFSGGGKGFLKPETSKAKSIGVVWTPTSSNLSLALDYFDYHIRGEIGTLGAGDILFGCYGAQVYPNSFCDLFHRNPTTGGEANKITDIHATYININSERTRGYDLQANFSQDFSFGSIRADAQITYTLEDITQLFSTAEASGFESSDRVGYIGNPQVVGKFDVGYKRGDWSFTWQGTYTQATKNRDISSSFTYRGYDDAIRDIRADSQFMHNLSVGYGHDNWNLTVGVRNLFDAKPDLISAGAGTRIGNTPLYASQYDWYGRTFFARARYKF